MGLESNGLNNHIYMFVMSRTTYLVVFVMKVVLLMVALSTLLFHASLVTGSVLNQDLPS